MISKKLDTLLALLSYCHTKVLLLNLLLRYTGPKKQKSKEIRKNKKVKA